MRGLAMLLLISAACAGSTTEATVPPPPAPETRATLVGPRCRTIGDCVCRDDSRPESEEPPADPYKRFEIRVGPIENALWVMVDDMVLYKSAHKAVECFYLDLIPGKHPVRIQGAGGEGGMAARVEINELSGGGPWWYPVFEFDCNGICAVSDLRAEQERMAGFDRGVQAPCGSTKIQSYRWHSGRAPDGRHPEEVAVELMLDVYEFATKHPPGSEQCKR